MSGTVRKGMEVKVLGEGYSPEDEEDMVKAQVEDIAKKKLADLNARDLDHAVRIIAGTARSMGLEVAG